LEDAFDENCVRADLEEIRAAKQKVDAAIERAQEDFCREETEENWQKFCKIYSRK
jgi:hypothetical protein